MVALIMRLRIAIARNDFTGNKAVIPILRAFLGFAVGIGALSIGFVTFDRPGADTDVMILVATAWGLGWIFTPLIVGAAGSALRPAQFALLPVRPREFAVALLVTSMVTVPVVFTAVGLSAPILHAARTAPLALTIAIPAVLAQTLLVVGLSRLASVALTAVSTSRKGQDLAMLFTVILGAFLWLAYMALQLIVPRVIDGDPSWLSPALRSVPFGWAALATGFAENEQWFLAVGVLAALVALVAMIALAWIPMVTRQLRWPTNTSSGGQGRKGRGKSGPWPAWTTSPTWVSARKELVLLWRDPRRKAQLLIVPVFLIVIFVGPLFAEFFAVYLTSATFILAILLVASFVNLYGFDGPALWQVIVTPGAYEADVRGKQIAWLMIAAPLLIFATALRYAIYGRGVDGAAFDVGITFAVLGAGAGAIVLCSAFAAYPVPSAKQGNPFSTRGSFNGSALLSALGTLVALASVFALFAIITAPGGFVAWLAVPIGVALGFAGWRFGGAFAISHLTEHGPEILQVVRKEP
ncbi:hypothetical protein IEU95_03615 [Hoyosella rhizosphaerae]|uniref:Transporter n=1 Tax=Hoyosella rhizosphaerae TaxID=1755582 RepID=A0A916XE65_9ACTN|nr:hypothetical protein [Hoyosella rhizosphaerae]MBN4925903.1 hypothetical protein [Hoyosella rhizosphaerae]GGC67055.1 transporter [Hoyosella rhizosphaerae]